MSDVKTFIDTVGRDVSAAVAPKIQDLAGQFSAKTFAVYGPRVSTFASQLVKDIIEDQSASVRDFVTAAIQDLCQRYHPELGGEIHAKIANGRVELTGRDVRLDLKRRDTGTAVASLDLPIALTITVPELAVKLATTTIRLDVVR